MTSQFPCGDSDKAGPTRYAESLRPAPPRGRSSDRGARSTKRIAVALAGLLVTSLVVWGAPRFLVVTPNAYTRCYGNLSQIAMAMLRYECAHNSLPPAYVPDEDGKPMHSWRVLILPYLDQEVLYRQYRFDEPWNGPHNKLLADKMPSVYRCPIAGNSTNSQTSYVMLVGPHAASDGARGRQIEEIKDGSNNTILVAEAVGAHVNWMEPHDLDAETMSFQINAYETDGTPAKRCISSNHLGLALVAFCDGHIEGISDDTDEKTLKALTTIDGGEKTELAR